MKKNDKLLLVGGSAVLLTGVAIALWPKSKTQPPVQQVQYQYPEPPTPDVSPEQVKQTTAEKLITSAEKGFSLFKDVKSIFGGMGNAPSPAYTIDKENKRILVHDPELIKRVDVESANSDARLGDLNLF